MALVVVLWLATVVLAGNPVPPPLPATYSAALVEQVQNANGTAEVLAGYMYVSGARRAARLDLASYGSSITVFWDTASGLQYITTTIDGHVCGVWCVVGGVWCVGWCVGWCVVCGVCWVVCGVVWRVVFWGVSPRLPVRLLLYMPSRLLVHSSACLLDCLFACSLACSFVATGPLPVNRILLT